MKNIAKAMVGTVAAGAMAVSSASPAFARDRDNGIDAGEVIAGALIIGGIAAVAAAASDNNRGRDRYGYRYNRDYRYGRAGYNYGHRHSGNAVSKCARAAEQGASRYSYGRVHVTRITSVKDKRRGFDVKGRIAINDRGYRYRGGRHGYDTGKFTCKVRYGRIADIRYSGLR